MKIHQKTVKVYTRHRQTPNADPGLYLTNGPRWVDCEMLLIGMWFVERRFEEVHHAGLEARILFENGAD
jgi:hypothetical protein